ncbi:MAG TPA: DUF4097 family beta strand repeat-containing protein [Vicinamibacterales bacterium]|nr:DUF4097 family beta strand repeat-containing protein [Vicinamibacterales bacterium]
MRQIVITILTLGALVAPASRSDAQMLPERIRAVVSERVEMRTARYQQGREEQTSRETKTVKIGADGELSLSNISGDIVVTRANGSDATIEIVKTARARTADEARELLGLVNVTVTERAGRTEVKTVYPQGDEMRRNRRNVNVSVNYTVATPAGTRLTISSISGSIRVSDIKGDVSANSISGTVRVANGGRIAAAKSVSGDVEIIDTQTDGAIDVQSVSGGVTLRKVAARRIDVGSVSGSVAVQDITCDRVQAHSVSGGVEFGGALAKGGRYEFNSHSGDVRVVLAGSTGFELEANSFSGNIRSDIPIKLQGDIGRRRSMQGVYGDGSAVLTVTTFSGSVVISRK